MPLKHNHTHRELEEKLHLISRENELLAESAELAVLLKIALEKINSAKTPSGLITTILERVCLTQDLCLGLCGSLTDDDLHLLSAYSAHCKNPKADQAMPLHPQLRRQLEKAPCIITGNDDFVVPDLTLDTVTIVPTWIAAVPFENKTTRSGLFLFATQADEPPPATLSLDLLQQIIDMTAVKLDQLLLVDELRALNAELDQRVADRTDELHRSNQRLKLAIAQREQSESALKEQVTVFRLGAEIGKALSQSDDLAAMTQKCCQALVDYLGAAFARIWLFNPAEKMLELNASAGQYTHLDGKHSRIRIGQLKIGHIGAERAAYLSNDISNDKKIDDAEWARRNGFVSFAGHPLVVADRLIGVIALFSQEPLSRINSTALGSVADQIAIGIDRKKAGAALVESESRYRSLVEVSPEAILVHTEDVIVFINQKGLDLFGAQKREEIVGRSIFDFIHPDDRALTKERIDRMLAHRTQLEPVEKRCLRLDGRIMDVEATGVFTVYMDKPSVLGVVRDITPKKRALADKQKLERQLQHAQKMEAIGTLAGGIAHDFNNLMMGIQGRASLMLMDCEPDSTFQRHLTGIEEHVKSAVHLTNQLLGFARDGKHEVAPLNLNQVVEHQTDLFGRTHKEIRIHLAFATDLQCIEADAGQLKQVILNLYLNALQAMPDGGDIRVKTRNMSLSRRKTQPYNLPAGDYVKLSITDAGTGMDAAVRRRIFEPFFTTKELGRGTGLGLASVYAIINNHRGFIEVSSVKGQGSTFDIYLPATDKSERPQVQGYTQTCNLRNNGGGTILLVDDETMIIDVAKELLTRLGYVVIPALNGKDAVRRFQGNRDKIDLVILDMVMPDMGGGQVYDELRRLDPQVKVLLSSGYNIDGQAEKIIKRGCNGFIQKPYSLQPLADKICSVLRC